MLGLRAGSHAILQCQLSSLLSGHLLKIWERLAQVLRHSLCDCIPGYTARHDVGSPLQMMIHPGHNRSGLVRLGCPWKGVNSSNGNRMTPTQQCSICQTCKQCYSNCQIVTAVFCQRPMCNLSVASDARVILGDVEIACTDAAFQLAFELWYILCRAQRKKCNYPSILPSFMSARCKLPGSAS